MVDNTKESQTDKTNLTDKLVFLKNWTTFFIFFFLQKDLRVSWHLGRMSCMLIRKSSNKICFTKYQSVTETTFLPTK